MSCVKGELNWILNWKQKFIMKHMLKTSKWLYSLYNKVVQL